ncbi:MAG: TRAP transporter small permease subunit, partial [Planctomycetes bacterium]|nr:TRAP transporter small permease subunit [Planctomycetota bacterium]
MGAVRYLAAILRRADRWLELAEEAVLVVLMAFLVFGGFWQVVARNFKLPTASWMETLLRHLVMWIGLIGASLATRYRKHVTIEAVLIYLPKRLHRPIHALLGLFGAGLAGLLTWASWAFVADERTGGQTLFVIEALDLHMQAWAMK